MLVSNCRLVDHSKVCFYSKIVAVWPFFGSRFYLAYLLNLKNIFMQIYCLKEGFTLIAIFVIYSIKKYVGIMVFSLYFLYYMFVQL